MCKAEDLPFWRIEGAFSILEHGTLLALLCRAAVNGATHECRNRIARPQGEAMVKGSQERR